MQLTLNGPSVLAVKELRNKIEKAGIDVDFEFKQDISTNNNDNTPVIVITGMTT
jgi:hypothetical protein